MHTRLLHASSPNETALPRTLFISVYAAEDALPFGETRCRAAMPANWSREKRAVWCAAPQPASSAAEAARRFVFVQQAGADRASM